MPEAEYMRDKQLDFFRARLQQLKDDLLSNAGETTEHLREDTRSCPTRPTARRSRRSTRWSCAPATGSASC
jgi:RNA polymerase-binding transcription factor DksA